MLSFSKMHFVKMSLTVLSAISLAQLVKSQVVDEKGYVVYCPCMGRFGNQFEHFLGSIAFAKGLDRTLILPPWVEYPPMVYGSIQVPFDTYIKVSKLKEYHKVITMESFMKNLAPTLWPPGKRISFCHSARKALYDSSPDAPESCNSKDGNPFGPFWDNFKIDFDQSEFYSPLYFDTWDKTSKDGWNRRYPAEKFPVLAFTGAPASFPVLERNIEVAQYVQWSNGIDSEASKFIKENLEDSRPFIGVHLRIGSDFEKACDHISDKSHLFATPQCLGYNFEHGVVTKDLCLPSEKTILKEIKSTINKLKAKAVFVATDTPGIVQTLRDHLKKKVKVLQLPSRNPHVDLAILTKSDHYIASCASSFSAVATRMRSTQNLGPTSFWALKPRHEEL